MMEDNPGDEIKRKVMARVEAEAEMQGTTGGMEDSEASAITQQFLLDCLEANELGDAELWKKITDGNFLFNLTSKKWLGWAGHHWRELAIEEVLATNELVARAYEGLIPKTWNQIREIVDDDSAKKKLLRKVSDIKQRVKGLRSVRRRKNVLEMAASSFNAAAVDGEVIDTKPHLLACPNGVVDLRTGELRPGVKSDFLLSACPTEFRGINEPCPLWRRFILEIMAESKELAGFLQVLFGVTIWGAVVEHIFVILHGPGGRNGKGTMMETIAWVLGKMLATKISSEMLLDTYRVNPSAPSPDRLALKGKRAVWAAEPEDGKKIATGKAKEFTGNDTLTARGHFQEETTFTPSHTLFLLSNYLMHADSSDQAFWERVINIPFDIRFVKIPETKNERLVNTHLPEELKAEASGILGWMVEGCLLWRRDGLGLPAKVVYATSEYRRDEDNYNSFIGFLCLLREDYTAGATELYDAFVLWWRRYINAFPPRQKKFGSFLKTKFHDDQRNGCVVYFGIKLRENWSDVLGYTPK